MAENHTNSESPLLVKIPEAQRLLGIGRTTLYKLKNTHEIEEVKIGSACRIKRSSIDDYIKKVTI